MNWHYSEFPYSDELYHFNVKGSHWRERRYQNEDGSLTPLGRIHYGVGKARKAYNDAANRAWNSMVTSYKRKHLNKMTQEELASELKRQQALSAISEEKRKQKLAKRDTERAKKVVGDILEGGVKTISAKAFNTLASKIFDKKNPAVKNLADVLTDESATIQEIREAKEKYETAIKYNREKAYNEYVKGFNDEFMKQYKDKKNSRMPSKDDVELANEYANILREISGSGNNGGGGKKKKGNQNNQNNQGNQSN